MHLLGLLIGVDLIKVFCTFSLVIIACSLLECVPIGRGDSVDATITTKYVVLSSPRGSVHLLLCLVGYIVRYFPQWCTIVSCGTDLFKLENCASILGSIS